MGRAEARAPLRSGVWRHGGVDTGAVARDCLGTNDRVRTLPASATPRKP